MRPLVAKFKPEGKLIRLEREIISRIVHTHSINIKDYQSEQSKSSICINKSIERIPYIESYGFMNFQLGGASSKFHAHDMADLNPNSPRQS